MQTLNQDIKTKTFKRVYLLFGDELFLKNSYKNRLKEAILEGDTINFSSFEGKNLDFKEVLRMADTMPFFADRRLILIENSGCFKNASEQILEYLPNIPETTCILFVETEVDKRNRLYKKVKELGYAAEMTRQDSSSLAKWAGTILAREGKKITGKTMELFLNMTGDDMEHIRLELDKLISYTLGKEIISEEDIQAVCSTQLENRIFDMIKAITEGDRRKGIELYEDLLALKEPPMRILFLIARQFNQILQVKELMDQGMDKGEIASGLRLKPFIVAKISAQARQFTREELLDCVKFCTEAEEAVKTGKMQDRLAVEMLMVKDWHEKKNFCS